jgi:hypothetical protein
VVLGLVCELDGTAYGNHAIGDSVYYGSDMCGLGSVHKSQRCRSDRQWYIDCDEQ